MKMWKYALSILTGHNPKRMIDRMPKKDFEQLRAFAHGIGSSNLPRRQRRAIQRKWNKVYGTQ